MKSIFFALGFMVFTVSAFGQDETLLNLSDNISVGGFGGPMFGIGSINGNSAISGGGGGGIVLNDFFIGGFGGGASVDGIDIGEVSIDNYDVSMGYGGLWLGYSFLDNKVVHPYASLKLAAGGTEASHSNLETMVDEQSFWLIEPEAGIEVNITSWMKLCLTAGYRGVSGIDEDALLNNSDFSGFTGGLTARFGFFGG